MRASRLLSILLLLQTRGRLTAEQLAAELEVSVRTVYRDTESLSAAGVPLYGEPGHDGGYRLADGYRTRLTGLTGAEAASLFLTGLPGPAADLGLADELASAELKLLAALPDEPRDRAAASRARFHLDPDNWYTVADPIPHLAALVDAVWRDRRVRLRYRRWAAPREVTRVVEPYGLVLKAGRWYLVAAAGGRPRTYRVGQVLELEVLAERFDRPDGFDLAAHWRESLADFDARRQVGQAEVLIDPELLSRLPDLIEPAAAKAAQDSARPVADGRLRVIVPVEEAEQAALMLLRLGPLAEVTNPPELRERLADLAVDLMAIYRRPDVTQTGHDQAAGCQGDMETWRGG